jgi:hypothetical protein
MESRQRANRNPKRKVRMKFLTIFTAALLCAKISLAEKKAEATPIPATKQAARAASPKTTATTSPTLAVTDTWTSFTVAPGTYYSLTSKSDYSGTDHISIAIECPAGNSLQNVSITVWWANAIAPYFAQTDAILGSNFSLTNMGGAVVPVYGPTLLLEVVNSGTTAVSCDQVTTYGVVH